MNTFPKKVIWLVRRHPMLYYLRFLLISRKHKANVLRVENYNSYNDKRDIPKIFKQLNPSIQLGDGSSLDKAKQLVLFLQKNIKGGPGLGVSSGKAIELMTTGKGGVCSDFSQVFNNFCIINDIKVREWGVVEKFYRNSYGHSFNEIFSEELQKWIMIDPSKGLLFYDSENNLLSAEEFFKGVRAQQAIHAFNFNPETEICEEYIRRIYFNPTCIPFLLFKYQIKTIDKWLDQFSSLPSSFMSLALIIFRKHFKYMMLFDDHRNLWSLKSVVPEKIALASGKVLLDTQFSGKVSAYKLSN